MAGAIAHDFGWKSGELDQLAGEVNLVFECLRRLDLYQLGNLFCDFFDVVDTERHCHALHRTKGIDQKRNIFADDVLEEQRRTASFHHSVSNFRDLQFRFDRMGDALELAGAVLKLERSLTGCYMACASDRA